MTGASEALEKDTSRAVPGLRDRVRRPKSAAVTVTDTGRVDCALRVDPATHG
ncbi:hypothetical protein [Streptomyces sp. CC219B]|uniref:hypothetical protein n=1 Tax=Streptomyces sp. CC219B TaxID=3044574 RepID=UPI0024A8FE39|nr:hypothetical protein [Streptomyces sp. CC219B]